MDAENLLANLINEWGERDVYSISNHSIEKFLSAGAELIGHTNNNDGTFSTTIIFHGKRLISISVEPTSDIS